MRSHFLVPSSFRFVLCGFDLSLSCYSYVLTILFPMHVFFLLLFRLLILFASLLFHPDSLWARASSVFVSSSSLRASTTSVTVSIDHHRCQKIEIWDVRRNGHMTIAKPTRKFWTKAQGVFDFHDFNYSFSRDL